MHNGALAQRFAHDHIGGVLLAAKQATSSIPIVFAVANDSVGAGFVPSLARPGGNITGRSFQTTDLAGKRIELLREAVPGIHRLGILANLGNLGAVPEVDEVQAAARILGLEIASSRCSGLRI
jgi:putative tryptophan/tyrosine transport system substrate-binding protein